MPKSINLGNGQVLIGLDHFGQVKDLYFHYPGLENHVGENLTHKIGVYVDNHFAWIDDGQFSVIVKSIPESMASSIVAKSESLGLEINFTDIVYNEKNIFLREVVVKNLFERARTVKIFFNQEFNISETHIGDTAYFDPREKVIIHYKGRRVFLINTKWEKSGFDEYSIGLLGIEGQVGTYIDAEDGSLTGNPIEHGQVDSVIGIYVDIGSKAEITMYYWVCIGKSLDTVKKLNEEILSRNPREIIDSTINYWKAWVNVRNFNFYNLSDGATELFKKSLIYIRAHVADNGAIIASGDSEMLQFGRDYYRYVWPRDASLTAIALVGAGDFNASRRFFEFATDLISNEGYFMHKYRPDKSLGSSWHPWVQKGKGQFPIQEDETALVIYSLWSYYEMSLDIEFIESIYNKLIKKAADFMCNYLDEKTGLPKSSYDLWEQDYGISTFTACTVYGALRSASKFAKLFGKRESEKKYNDTAEMIKKGILKYLYDEELGSFYKMISTESDKAKVNKVLDFSSIYGIYKFELLPVDDVRLKNAMEISIDRLSIKTDIGGVARYEGDMYHFKGGDYPGNPWIITTLWLAQYYIRLAKSEKDLIKVNKYLEWCVKMSGSAGTLSEQMNPYTGEQLSASPLIWSHAEYVTTVILYIDKMKELVIK